MGCVTILLGEKRPRLHSKTVVLALANATFLMACGGNDQGQHENTAEYQQLSISDAELAGFVAKLSQVEQQLFSRFLTGVWCTPTGCAVQDMVLRDRSEVAEFFVAQILDDHPKGLVVPDSLKYTSPITVCWATNSDASLADKAAVIANVEATWGTYADVTFDWYSSGTTPRTCNASQAPSYNVKIWQHSTQIRGCSKVGNNGGTLGTCGQSCDNNGNNCTPRSTPQPSPQYTNMYLRVPDADSTDIHEFGHAIGLYHEQDHTGSTCTNGREAQEPGARQIASYDPNSIMNYCSIKMAGAISSGDVVSAVWLYGGLNGNHTFRARSWLPTNVTYTVVPPNTAFGTGASATQTSVSLTPSDFAFGTAATGSFITVTPSDPTLRCSVTGVAPQVNDDTYDVMYPSSPNTIPAECYSPAIMTTFL